MQFLLPLASLLGIEINELLDRLKRNAIAWSAVAVFVLVGTIFLLVGINAALAEWIGPVWAPIAIAGTALVIALGTFISIRSADTRQVRMVVERKRGNEKTALATTAALAALPMVLKSDLVRKVGIPIGGALVAAFLVYRDNQGRNKRP